MKIKQLLIALFLTLSVTAHCGEYISDSCRINGRLRHYVIYLPENINDNAPLIVVLHGYGGYNNPKRFDLDAVADQNGFAVCYPLGLKDPAGKASFNVGYPSQAEMKVDDVDDICKLTRIVQKKYHLSKHNLFCTGMSNGGDMCYLLGVSKQNIFSAFASVAGLNFIWSYQKYEAPAPVPFMEIHGTNDKVSKWTGDLNNEGGWGPYLPVPLGVGYWVAKNRCLSMVSDTLPIKSLGKSHLVKRHKYVGGVGGNEVWLYEIEGGGHSWGEKDLNTGEEIWGFFQKYLK